MSDPETNASSAAVGGTRSAPQRGRYFVNAAAGFVLYIVSMVVAFILSPVMVRELGNRDYGIWDLLLGLTGYFGILELGLGPAIMRYVALASRTDDADHLRRVFNSALAVFLLLGAVCLLVMGVLTLFPEQILNVKPGEVPHAELLFVLLGLNVAIQFPGNVLTGYVMGLQRHSILNLSRAALSITTSVIVYRMLTRWDGPKLIALAGLTLASNLALYGGLSIWIGVTEKRLRLSMSYFSWSTMRELYQFGFKSMLLMVSDRIRRATMPLVITQLIGVQYIVFYAIPNRLTEYVSQFSQSIGFPLTPYFSALSGREDEDHIRREWFDLSRILQFIQLGSALGMLALGYDFIHRWMGPEYAEKGKWVVFWLGMGLLVNGLAVNAVRLLIGLARQELAVRLFLPASVVTVILAIPLALYFGVSGVALAIFVTWDLTTIVVLWEACRAIGITLADHFRHTVVRNIAPLFILGAALLGLRALWPPHDYDLLLMHVLVAGSIYLVAGWFLTLKPEERRAVGERWRAWRRGRRAAEPPAGS